MPAQSKPPTPEAFLSRFNPDIADLAARFREALRARYPELEERVYEGWGGLGYHVRTIDGRGGYLSAIFPRESHIDIEFEHGADLPDPHGLFYRGGKQLRYARLDAWDAERVQHLLDLVDAAMAWQMR